MPTRNVNLTDPLDRFVEERVASGQYQNASEVVREALRALQRREAEDALRLARLRAAIAEGEDAIARGDFTDLTIDGLDDYFAALHDGAEGTRR